MSGMNYQGVPEKTLFIDLPDSGGLKLKAILRGSLDKPVVVMVHGLPGEGNELLQFLGARYLYEHGFSTLRLYLYSFEDNTRNLVDCTLETHVADFEAAVDYLRSKKVPLVLAEGHSYGGITILKSLAMLDGAVLWDPSHGLVFRDPEVLKYYENVPIEETDKLKLFLSGYGYIEPKSITDEQDKMGDTTDWAKNKNYPLKIVSAGKGVMTKLHERYIKVADAPKSHVTIEEAHHQFEDSDDIMLRLFKETADWFKEIKSV